jgi:hypothetical protein
MEADFAGYATKAGLKCSDGRTIMPNAFQHQDKMQVPLVWQHGHTDPENILGHAILENRDDGVYAYGFFNGSKKAQAARDALEHNDIKAMSIWANELVERAGRVLHGAIREVSLVLSGANPGALIDHVTIRHSDDSELTLEDEAIITTGLELEHGVKAPDLVHAEDDDDDDDGPTVEDVYNSMTQEQKDVLHFMIGEALESAGGGEVKQSAMDLDEDATVEEVYNTMNEAQKDVLHYMIGEALEQSDSAQHDNTDPKGNEMKHNVFESGTKDSSTSPVLSHSDIEGIVADATKTGSLKEAVEGYALAHGIDDIDILFPEARSLTNTPEFFGRRTEWVNSVLSGARKSPFSRIKTMSADLTADEARAKGYIKGNLKKEEFFQVSKRVTTPTTVYKKQKLDRDDMVDITDFDVVAWLKGEMRLMLDEEIARAVLVGDGRDFDDEDKISETNIRPISKDHELYTVTVNVNIDDNDSHPNEILDAIVAHRHLYRGTGLPTLYTTETYISMLLLIRDTLGRRIYKSLDEIAAELRVSSIVPVDILDEDPTLVCIIVNMNDYVIGADQGGNVAMFDDFDIDYNQYKYLIETRVSGALVKLKSAMVVRKTAGSNTLATPVAPTFADNEVEIPEVTGVVYQDASDGSVLDPEDNPFTVASGERLVVDAVPAAGYYFPSSENTTWTFFNRG